MRDHCDICVRVLCLLLFALGIIRKELAAMRRPNYVRRMSDERTGVAALPDRDDKIRVRWDDDGTRSDPEPAENFETLSFDAHVAARLGAP